MWKCSGAFSWSHIGFKLLGPALLRDVQNPTCVTDLCCTIKYPLSSLRLNCCVRAESQPWHSCLISVVWLTVCCHSYIKKCRSTLLRLLSREALLSPPQLHVLCDCDLCVFGGALCIPCSPLTEEFYHPPRTPCPWTNIQVAGSLLFPSGWCLLERDNQHIHTTLTCRRHMHWCANVDLFFLKIKASSVVISLSLSHWNWQCRQPNLNKSFIVQ